MLLWLLMYKHHLEILLSVLFGYISRSGIVGSYDTFVRNDHHSSFIILHSHQQCTVSSFSTYLPIFVVFCFFFFIYIPGILIRLVGYHIVGCCFWFLFASPFHMACGISSLRGTERLNLAAAVKVPSSHHWTAEDFPRGSFDLHFPNDWWCGAPCHVLISSLQISFWEMCI